MKHMPDGLGYFSKKGAPQVKNALPIFMVVLDVTLQKGKDVAILASLGLP